MNSRILIDGIVRQTTVLIARLATIEGALSPLGRAANEMLGGLATELEGQGIDEAARADLFGMALRSYRKRVGGLTESETLRGTSLWSAVLSYLSERPCASEGEVLSYFHKDEASCVCDVLEDLAEGHFLIRSVQGNVTLYSAPSGQESPGVVVRSEERELASLAALVWVVVFREGPLSLLQLGRLVPAPLQDLERAMALLTAEGKVSSEGREDEREWSVRHVLIPLCESAGWEAAILDHHRTVSNAIASKIESGRRTSARKDEVGGTTLTFDLWRGHPNETAVRQLLAETRSRILALWEEVERHGPGDASSDPYQVHFYCGQYVLDGVEDESVGRNDPEPRDGAPPNGGDVDAGRTTMTGIDPTASEDRGDGDSDIGERETWT